ncbi:MAG TPA: hypothetical protein VF796_13215 [Humisphaera sp.]
MSNRHEPDLPEVVEQMVSIVVGFAVCFGAATWASKREWSSGWAIGVAAAAGAVAGLTVWFALTQWRAAGHDRAKRRIRGGLCAHCGYDLRGQKAVTRCPECGVTHFPPPIG